MGPLLETWKCRPRKTRETYIFFSWLLEILWRAWEIDDNTCVVHAGSKQNNCWCQPTVQGNLFFSIWGDKWTLSDQNPLSDGKNSMCLLVVRENIRSSSKLFSTKQSGFFSCRPVYKRVQFHHHGRMNRHKRISQRLVSLTSWSTQNGAKVESAWNLKIVLSLFPAKQEETTSTLDIGTSWARRKCWWHAHGTRFCANLFW